MKEPTLTTLKCVIYSEWCCALLYVRMMRIMFTFHFWVRISDRPIYDLNFLVTFPHEFQMQSDQCVETQLQ